MIVWFKSSRWVALLAVSIAACSCGFHHAKYENPIAKDSQQPDKLLYDRAIKDLEKGRYELSRLTLNTLINTYDSSEFLAKAKLAIADSWYREGGASGLAQAEAEYKDFELFYPTMPEASESQYKICKLHFQQMDKPDRDSTQVLRAEQECKQVVMQYPNSKFVPDTLQKLREIDEVLGEGEMRTADFYFKKGSRAAAANRYTGLVEQYPLYSRADEALWKEADAYVLMGARLKPRAIQAYQKIVRDYPLSIYSDPAKKKLREMEAEVPEADPSAVARMKYEQENRTKTSLLHNATAFLRPSPETSMAAKVGTPAMTPPKQNIPVNVPLPATAGTAGFVGDVTVAPAGGASAAVSAPAATSTATPAAAGTPATDTPSADKAAPATPQASASNSKDKKKNDKKAKKAQKQDPNQTPTQTPDPNQTADPNRPPSTGSKQ